MVPSGSICGTHTATVTASVTTSVAPAPAKSFMLLNDAEEVGLEKVVKGGVSKKFHPKSGAAVEPPHAGT